MLLNIYYLFGLIALLGSFINLFRFNKFYYIIEWISKFKKINGKTPRINEFRKKDDYNIFISLSVSKMAITIWLIFGLFTNNWYVFLSLIMANFLINIIIKKWTLLHKYTLFLKANIDVVVILSLIIKKFI